MFLYITSRINKSALAVAIFFSISSGLLLANENFRLEEVVVTATKREQSLSDVGMSVSALSGDQMRMQGISSVADLALSTPGLVFTPSQAATPVYTMRGIGFFESSLAAYPAVSLYQNQIPMPFPVMASLVAFDLERVEVMKGPQGTLFGNNATGGAVNFVPAQPTEDFGAGLDLNYGRFNTREVGGYISGPLFDTVRARAAIKAVRSDEWQKSYTRQDELGKKDNLAGRVLIDWTPSDQIDVQLSFNGWRNEDEPLAPSIIGHRPQYSVGQSGFGGGLEESFPVLNVPLAPKDNRRADWPVGLPYQDHEFWQASLRVDYEMRNDITFTSLSSYGELDYNAAVPGAGSYLKVLELREELGDLETWSQEIRLANNPINSFRWLLGFNYEESEVFQITDLIYPDSTSYAVDGITNSIYSSDQVMKNTAGFVSIEYDVIDALTVKGGVRQTNAKRRGNAYTGDMGVPVDSGYSLTDFFNLVYDAVYGGAVSTISDGESVVLDPLSLETIEPRGRLNENSTSWSFGIDYRITPGAMLYGNIMKGYKAGSFPHLAGAVSRAFDTVRHESVLSYEIGLKGESANGRHSLSGAFFYNKYDNKQQRSKFIDPIFGQLDRLENIPKSVIKGVELQVSSRPLERLTLSASVTYLDAKIKDYEGTIGQEILPNGLREEVKSSFRGAGLPYTPNWQYSLKGVYDFSLSDSLDAFIALGVDGQTESISILTIDADDKSLYRIGTYNLINGSIGIKSSDDRWQAMIWGKNITDKRYWQNTMLAFDTVGRYHGRPAEYGISISYRY